MADSIQPPVNPYAQLYGRLSTTNNPPTADAAELQCNAVLHPWQSPSPQALSSPSRARPEGFREIRVPECQAPSSHGSIAQRNPGGEEYHMPRQKPPSRPEGRDSFNLAEDSQQNHSAPASSAHQSLRDGDRNDTQTRKRRFSEQPHCDDHNNTIGAGRAGAHGVVNQIAGISDQRQRTSSISGAASCTSQQRIASAPEDVVLIWDLDETLILFHSLINGRYAAAHSVEADHLLNLGSQMQDALNDICDDYFFFEQVEELDQMQLSSLSEYDDGQDLAGYNFTGDSLHELTKLTGSERQRLLAYRYRVMRPRYNAGLSKLEASPAFQIKLSRWKELLEAIDKAVGGWLSHAAQLVRECSRNPHQAGIYKEQQKKPLKVHNVVITTGQLIPTLAKLLLFNLSDAFSAENIYSARNDGKAHCFDHICRRFGNDAHYCAIGDGVEEEAAASAKGWPFIKIALSTPHESSQRQRSPALNRGSPLPDISSTQVLARALVPRQVNT